MPAEDLKLDLGETVEDEKIAESIQAEAEPRTTEVAAVDRASRRAIGLAMIYGLSGFASLTLEVAWARLV